MESSKVLGFICTCTLLLGFQHLVKSENLIEKINSNNPRVPPFEKPGVLINVNVSIWILDLMRVDDANQEITTQMYFRQAWKDHRMRRRDNDKEIKYLVFDDLKKVWHPDLFIIDESDARMNVVPFPNAFIRWGPDGDMLMSVRFTITTRCRMDFTYFPHDHQTCTFLIESYAYNADQISLHWDDPRGPVGITDPVQVNNFKVTGLKNGFETVQFKTANYSRLTLKLSMQRNPGFYITKVYIPYILLTCVSFVTLWISHKLVLPRLSLALTVLSIMFALASHIQEHIPRVTYTKAMDVWLAFCITIVFSVFLEFIFVVMIHRPRKDSQDSTEATVDVEIAEKEGKESISRKLFPFSSSLFQSKLRQNSSKRMDYASRFLFPLLFGLFNIIYWSTYTL